MFVNETIRLSTFLPFMIVHQKLQKKNRSCTNTANCVSTYLASSEFIRIHNINQLQYTHWLTYNAIHNINIHIIIQYL